jgi:hypothetical protein
MKMSPQLPTTLSGQVLDLPTPTILSMSHLALLSPTALTFGIPQPLSQPAMALPMTSINIHQSEAPVIHTTEIKISQEMEPGLLAMTRKITFSLPA